MTKYLSSFVISEEGFPQIIEAGFRKKISLKQAKIIANWCRKKDYNTMAITDITDGHTYHQHHTGENWIESAFGA